MTFRCTLALLSLCAGMSARGVQRDSSSVATGLGERLSPAGHFMHEVYGNPAAQVYRFKTSLTTIGLSGSYRQEDEAVVSQVGRGNRYAAFDAQSYIRRGKNTVWGGAGYRLGRTMHTEWNENADFELLYPYVWADSLGGPKLYQMLGLGMYSTRFSSSENNTSVYFSGRTYGAGLELFPRDGAGLFLSVHYSGWAVRRILPGYQKLPLTRLVDNVFDGALGWQGQSGIHHWGIKLSGNYAKRLGTEYIYGDASGSQNYPKLGAVEQYRNNRTDLVLSALWGFEEMRGWSFYAEPRGRYYDFEATYLSPSRKMQFGKVGCGGGLTVEKRLRRSVLHLSVSADYLANQTAELKLDGLDMDGSIGQMMQRNFGHLSADMTLYGASFRWNYDFPRASMALYVQGDWQHGSFADGNRSDYARIVFGVAF